MPFLADLSVSKTHFTDKPAFSSGLSVNFWPLYWEFTDKRRFSEHLSVKPGPKRLNFYGQTAGFDYFVRNRHFWRKSFTDKRPIFIDLSVNGRAFAKCSGWILKLCARSHHVGIVVWQFVRSASWQSADDQCWKFACLDSDGFFSSHFKKFDGRRGCGNYFVGSRQMFWLNTWQSVDLLLKYVDA